MLLIDENERYLEFPEDPELLEFIAPFKKLRAGILLDPDVAEAWSCDPERCRPVMGRNLCCKVDTRCRHLKNGLCSIHEMKPYSCALFPLELWRVGNRRVLLSAKNPIPYIKGWSRYDRDMLRCFGNEPVEGPSMVEVQLTVLGKVFTKAELNLLMEAVEKIRADLRGQM